MKGLGQVVAETVEKTGEEVVKAVDSVISGKELVADAKVMDPKKADEIQKKDNEELRALRRDVEGEMDEARRKRMEEEERKEKEFLENLKRQREAEQQEVVVLERKHSRPKRGGAFARGGKAKPSQSDMSATGEFKGKID